jgi:hypothetical protein
MTHPLVTEAQALKSSDYQNNPAWVQMMSDPNVNYFEAIKAYEDYWRGKEQPEEEEEQMEMMSSRNYTGKMTDAERKKQEEEIREYELKLKRNSEKKLSEADLLKLEWKREMGYQCKRFKDWKASVKPYVQNDGRILNEEERMKIYNQRQEELKNK